MIHIRQLTRADSGLIESHLRRFGAEDRRLRFGAAMTDHQISRYVAQFPWSHAVVFGHVRQGSLLGMGMLVWSEGVARLDWKADGEAAFTVERAHRRTGVGGTLMRAVITAARNRFLKRLYVHCLQDNLAMRRLAQSFAPAVTIADGEVDAVIGLGPPTHLTLYDEWITETRGWMDGIIDHYRVEGVVPVTPPQPRTEPRTAV